MGISLTYARDVYTKKRPKPEAKQKQKTICSYISRRLHFDLLISVKKIAL